MTRVLVLVCIAIGAPSRARCDTWDRTTIAWQSAGGALCGLGGGIALGVVGFAIGGARSDGPRSEWKPLGYGARGAVIGVAAGVIVGVQLFGDAAGGTGRWYGTTLGGVAGTGVVVGGWLLSYRTTDRPRHVDLGLAISGALLLAGPIVGYHLSARERTSTGAQRVVPILVGAF